MNDRYTDWFETLAINERDVEMLRDPDVNHQMVGMLILATHLSRVACEIRALTEAIREMDEESECSEHANFQVLQ